MATLDSVIESAADADAWWTLFALGGEFPGGWSLIGGRVVQLHALIRGVAPLRSTHDFDLVVDIQARQDGLRKVSQWLEMKGFTLAGINAWGIGQRYVIRDSRGESAIAIDLLAPDHIGPRADLTTSPPARTVTTPGGRLALNYAERIVVSLQGLTAFVLAPPLVPTILWRASSLRIAVPAEANAWRDLAFLFALLEEVPPLGPRDLRRLSQARALLDESHPAWKGLQPDAARAGQAALRKMIGP